MSNLRILRNIIFLVAVVAVALVRILIFPIMAEKSSPRFFVPPPPSWVPFWSNLTSLVGGVGYDKWNDDCACNLSKFCRDLSNFRVPLWQHVPVQPALQLHRPWTGLPPFWHAFLLHALVSLKWYGHFPPQHSVTLFPLVRLWVPALPHWWVHPLQPDHPPGTQFRGGGGGGFRLRRLRNRIPLTRCRSSTRPIQDRRRFIFPLWSLFQFVLFL